MDQDKLLDDFFEWYIQKYRGATGGTRLEKIKEAQRALKEDFEEVAGICKIKEKGLGSAWSAYWNWQKFSTRGKRFSPV